MKSGAFSLMKENCSVQMFRYLTLGVLMNSVGYLLYILMTSFGIDPKVAMSIGYVIGLVVSFSGNREWTFSHEGSFSWAASRFFLMHLSGYLFNLACLYVFVDMYGYPHYIVQLCAMAVLAGYFFLVLKLFVFKPQSLD